MLGHGGSQRDLAGFLIPEAGRLVESGDPWMPYQLVDSNGLVVEPLDAFFAELQAQAKPASTIRSYGIDLLRWWRFLLCTCQGRTIGPVLTWGIRRTGLKQ
ncbi:hypothetical protein ACFY0G_30820 [Streptomyces sp. NPDC001552]|uniref:hypothetical protein n=1 Tax=Streptomyces sp. NPDC001552 TaxID=3364587 RepID=UPI0036ABFB07